MRIDADQLRHLIREILYRASAPKRYGLPDVEVDADNTVDAGRRASDELKAQHGVIVDPFSIDIQEVPPEEPAASSFQPLVADPKEVTDEMRQDITDAINLDVNDELDTAIDDVLIKYGVTGDDIGTISEYIEDLQHSLEELQHSSYSHQSAARSYIEGCERLERLLTDIFGGHWSID